MHTEVTPVRSEERLVRLRHPLKTLLVGANGGGQLLLPDSVGRAHVLQHPIYEFPQPRRLWSNSPLAKSINVLLNGQHADRGDRPAVTDRVSFSASSAAHPKNAFFHSFIFLPPTEIYSRTGVGNLRPRGHMWPV